MADTKALRRAVDIEREFQKALKREKTNIILALEAANHEEYADTVVLEDEVDRMIQAKDETLELLAHMVTGMETQVFDEVIKTNGTIVH